MTETTQEERENARRLWDESPNSEPKDIWRRVLNDADRLAAIERQLAETIERHTEKADPMGWQLQCLIDDLRAILEAPGSGGEDYDV